MEMAVFRTIDFDLGVPLSYRFLRRYARVSINENFSQNTDVIYLLFY